MRTSSYVLEAVEAANTDARELGRRWIGVDDVLRSTLRERRETSAVMLGLKLLRFDPDPLIDALAMRIGSYTEDERSAQAIGHFTPRLRRAFRVGTQLSLTRRQRDVVCTDDLFLALVWTMEESGDELLSRFRLQFAEVVSVFNTSGVHEGVEGYVSDSTARITPSALGAFETAEHAALANGTAIGTGDLLIALLAEGSGMAAAALRTLGVSHASVADELRRLNASATAANNHYSAPSSR